jgi:CHAT domain-containing protein
LILAGANQRRSGEGEDGILTASEVTALDLWGTRLVVLSACDTGLGEVRNGEGVYGLRRAMVLAGAQSQVMSLWQVADKPTRELMVDYYKGLQRNAGRSDALRNAQLRMLQSRDRQHPYYWAAFIASGEWSTLEGKREAQGHWRSPGKAGIQASVGLAIWQLSVPSLGRIWMHIGRP